MSNTEKLGYLWIHTQATALKKSGQKKEVKPSLRSQTRSSLTFQDLPLPCSDCQHSWWLWICKHQWYMYVHCVSSQFSSELYGDKYEAYDPLLANISGSPRSCIEPTLLTHNPPSCQPCIRSSLYTGVKLQQSIPPHCKISVTLSAWHWLGLLAFWKPTSGNTASVLSPGTKGWTRVVIQERDSLFLCCSMLSNLSLVCL